MKPINIFIIEKLKLSKDSKLYNENNPLFIKLDTLLDNNRKHTCIFDDQDIDNEYHIANLVISVNPYSGYITLDNIIIKGHNQGYGTKFMKDLCYWCDLNNKTLVLTPSNDFGSNLRRLKKFYKRFGLVENKGKSHDFSTKETMIRKPR